MEQKLSSALRCAVVSFLWLVTLASIGLFSVITFGRVTPWYAQHQDWAWVRGNTTIYLSSVEIAKETVITNGKNATKNIGRDTALLSGSLLFPVRNVLSFIS